MKSILPFLIILLSLNCHTDIIDNMDNNEDEKTYIFIGHCYSWTGNSVKVDSRIENYNLTQFDEIWLGGDVCSATSVKISTLDYVDELFDLSSEKTLWAVGNHDIIDGHKKIIDYTGRDFYYSQHADGITKIVFNTNLEDPVFKNDCEFKENQLDFTLSVLDTISESSHLVMIMHGASWDEIEENMGARPSSNAPAGWVKMKCEPATWFRLSIFPKLQEVQARGVQVILVSGDGGQYDKRYYYTTKEGIECYISGINNSCFEANPDLVNKFNTDPDSILLFHHNLKEKTLIGEFILLK